MSWLSQSKTGGLTQSWADLSFVALVFVLVAASQLTVAQEAKRTTQPAVAPVARGQYIVENVAMCGNCHTPRKSNGELDRSRWLAGGSVPYLPAYTYPDWPLVAPRLAGTPPAADAGMITLLTTGIWITGQPLRDPMPHFHMTVSDAEAVVAYLKSLTPQP
jgi:mono/diheme cytochrome c family protein